MGILSAGRVQLMSRGRDSVLASCHHTPSLLTLYLHTHVDHQISSIAFLSVLELTDFQNKKKRTGITYNFFKYIPFLESDAFISNVNTKNFSKM
jgi:hypothetical protein